MKVHLPCFFEKSVVTYTMEEITVTIIIYFFIVWAQFSPELHISLFELYFCEVFLQMYNLYT